MKPLVLEMQGIRSFRNPQTIDFRDLSFFAILGDTGAGKSSILEAIVYALFNTPTWAGAGVRELMSLGANSMRVKFTFRIGAHECSIERVTRRGTAPAQHVLHCSGEPSVRLDTDAAIAAFLRDRLGLERETFLKTVLLPQGRFAELLLMSASDRSKFLTDVLGLHVLDKMADGVRAPRDRAVKKFENLKGARNELPANPDEEISAADRAAAVARVSLKGIEKIVERYDTSSSEIKRCKTLVEAADVDRRRIEEALAVVVRLRALAADEPPYRERVIAAERARDDADLTRAAIVAERAKRREANTDAASLRKRLTTATMIVDRNKALQFQRGAHDSARQEVFERRKVLADQEEAASEKLVFEQTVERRVEELRADAGRAQQLVSDVSSRAARIATAAAEKDLARRILTESAARLDEAAAAYAAAGAEVHRCADAFAIEEKRLAAARRAHAAAHAAAGLQAGDACPVCARTLPESFAPPREPALAAVERAFKDAEKRREAARSAEVRAEAVNLECVTALEARRKDLASRTAALAELVTASADVELSEDVTENNHLLEKLQEARVALERNVTTETASLLEAKRIRERAERGVAAAREALSAASAREAENAKSVAALEAELGQAIDELPESSRPASDFTPAQLAELRDRIAADLTAAEKLEASASEAERTYAEALAAVHEAGEAWSIDIERPRRAAFERLRSVLEDEFDEIPGADFVGKREMTPAAMSVVVDAAAERLIARRERNERTRSDAATLLTAAEAAAAAVLAECGAGDGDGLRRLRDGRLNASTLANRDLEIARSRRDRAAELDRELARVEPAMGTLLELAESLTPNRFPKFIVERKQLELLQVGTTILRRMTGDRYGFSVSLGIVDRTIGQERKAHTLSGGETFLASLALSLALVEISERSGVRFESLFLDEGFGTLDPEAFEQALTELEHQVKQGRMIAVITHVPRIREYIDDVLRVTKTADGSQVEREQTSSAA